MIYNIILESLNFINFFATILTNMHFVLATNKVTMLSLKNLTFYDNFTAKHITQITK